MALTNPREWLIRAKNEIFAIGAFNANTLEQVQAVVEAAQQEAAPVMIQVSHRAMLYVGDGDAFWGMRYMAKIGQIAVERVSVPVALHLDHATADEVLQALDMGFTSVMFDGGDLPFEENMELTRKLTDRVHAAGATMEAEIGEVPRADTGQWIDPNANLTDPQKAAIFVQETGVDALAVAIGSVHAVKNKQVVLDLDRLKQIRSRVGVPLVLHGSSGVVDADILDGIHLGLCKVNVATQMNKAFSVGVRQVLEEDEKLVDPRVYLKQGRVAMTEAVRERIRFFGSSGKAKG